MSGAMVAFAMFWSLVAAGTIVLAVSWLAGRARRRSKLPAGTTQ
jgi:hypothetical protein